MNFIFSGTQLKTKSSLNRNKTNQENINMFDYVLGLVILVESIFPRKTFGLRVLN